MITVAKNAGFCFGVKRAVDELQKRIDEKSVGERIFTLGSLIHNNVFNEGLVRQGVTSVSVEELPTLAKSASEDSPITVIVRAHGIPRETEALLRSLSEANESFRYVDCTCPFVKKIHRIAEENTSGETVFLHFCHKDHPEALGNMSYAKGEKYAISSIEDLKMLNLSGKIPILCSQTTENLVEFKKIKNFLKKDYTNAIFFDTICSVTENRQTEAIELAKASDGMIVIGGRNSSNTKKLYDLCKAHCKETICIESADEIPKSFPEGKNKIAITAGASTPGELITEVRKQWK